MITELVEALIISEAKRLAHLPEFFPIGKYKHIWYSVYCILVETGYEEDMYRPTYKQKLLQKAGTLVQLFDKRNKLV